MARFFTSPQDLIDWVKQSSSADEAASKIITVMGSTESEQDVYETTTRIFADRDVSNAANVLFNLLATRNITEQDVVEATAKSDQVLAADVLFEEKLITSSERDKMKKEAQIMRQPGQYEMPLRICPKLPKSVGNRLISTYNCRHYCLDGIVFDDDPGRVYCYEAMWRRHVMDKFAREWKDPKSGEWVGGYINSRFHVFPDASTPAATKDVPKDHGNKMALAPWERTREPRPHQFSIERRLEEQRDPGSTESIALAYANRDGIVKIAAEETLGSVNPADDDAAYQIFSQAIDLHNKGMHEVDAAAKIAEDLDISIEHVVSIQSHALRKMASHVSDVYAMNHGVLKTAQVAPAMPSTQLFQAPVEMKVTDEAGEKVLPVGAIVSPQGNDLYQLFDPNSGSTGKFVQIDKQLQPHLQSLDEIQNAAQEVGLNENPSVAEVPAVAEQAEDVGLAQENVGQEGQADFEIQESSELPGLQGPVA